MEVHNSATWRIPLNRPCAAAIRPFVKFLSLGYLLLLTVYSLLFTVLLRQRMLKDSIVEAALRLSVTPMKVEDGNNKGSRMS